MQKGEHTRHVILDEAADLASVVGLEGLSIGTLAAHTGMSKSGLFSHFGSKESLQVETLKAASELFAERVVLPALKAKRGIPRLRKLFDLWLGWSCDRGLSGGCLFIAASIELDDRPGPAREYLVSRWKDWYEVIERIAAGGVASGDFREDLDYRQFAYDLNNVFFGFQHERRLLVDRDARAHAKHAFKRILADARP